MTLREARLNHLLDDLVRTVVRTVQPRKIILFGSSARGEMTEDSDLDLLVIMPDGTHRRQTARRIYRALSALGHPKDVVVVTEEDIRRFGNEPSLVLCPAIKEGKELYRAS